MSEFLNKEIVLAVNALWQPIGITTPEKAISSMFSTRDGENLAAKAFVIDYPENDGVYDFESPNPYPVFLDEWLKQPIRPFDNAIHTSRLAIRVPTVIQSHNYNKVHMKQIRATKKNLYKFYGGRCIWTGEKISWAQATIEHLNPKSNGGGDGWDNVAIARKDINNKRGNTPLKDFHLKPQYSLKEPKPVPASSLINDIRHIDWKIFIK